MKLRYFILVLALASCIPVDDFGTFWKKAVIDKKLVGTWQADAAAEGGRKPTIKIAVHKGQYQIDSMDEDELKKPGYKPIMAKTLAVGEYTFLIGGPKEGFAERYKLQGAQLQIFDLKAGKMLEFLKDNPSSSGNIGSVSADDKSSLRIKTFDGDVYKTLSAIPDTAEYWQLTGEYYRMP